MRVAHFSTWDAGGGAARSAYRLHRALLDARVDSRLVVLSKSSCDSTVQAFGALPQPFGRLLAGFCCELDSVASRLYPRRSGTLSGGWLSLQTPWFKAAREADVVHVHWAGGFVSARDIGRFNKPVIMTMRDLEPMTGGCRYPGECRRFLESCGYCPQLGSIREHDMTRRSIERKLRYWGRANLHIVAVSSWEADLAAQSSVLRKLPVALIHNGVDTEVFKPYDKQAMRRRWSLPSFSKILLFGAISVADVRKGGVVLQQALDIVMSRYPDKDLFVVTFGAGSMAGNGIALPHIHLGLIDSDSEMACLYSAADVTIAPSLEDACPKVPIESMACGTPTVAFGNTGIRDIIHDGHTGILVDSLEAQALADGVAACLTVAEKTGTAEACRRRSVDLFDIRRVARSYMDLYAKASKM
jgi:glycosyltransferase involved in cell wall biosynthesis